MPKVTRRQFLKISGAGVVTFVMTSDVTKAMELNVGGKAFNYDKVAIHRSTAFTVSPFGKMKGPLEVALEKDAVVAVLGQSNHPASRGGVTSVDAVSHIMANDPDRLTYPMKRTGKRGSGQWKKITWEEALKEIAGELNKVVADKGRDSVWLVRGEDSPTGLWKRFMNTIGTSSIIEMAGDAGKKTGQSLTWGETIETPDFANSRYILNFGSNLYETFQSCTLAVADGKSDKHAKLVTFDPRMSMTAGLSDEWIPIVPGSDGLVALAMANVIMQEGLANTAFINSWTNFSAEKLAKHLSQFTLEAAEKESGVPAAEIRRIAIEFASAKPSTVFTYRGASSHANGVYNERACMLLPIITGNVEVEGGYCLPRRIEWKDISPAPQEAKQALKINGATFPQAVKDGQVKANLLFVYNTNPAYSASSSAYWRGILGEDKLIPLSVCVTQYMTETANLCDVVLPSAMFLESSEPVTSPSLFPWMGARTRLSKAPDEVKELPVILRDMIRAVDADGNKGLKKYWEFEDPQEWLVKYVESIHELKDAGGLDAIASTGIWPNYGTLDIKTGKVLDSNGKPLKAKYGLYKTKGFATPSRKIEIYSEALKKKGLEPLPVWIKPGNLNAPEGLEKEGLIFVTFKTAYHAGSSTANNKYLMEKDHSNHCWINKETAGELKIKDGDLIRLVSSVGYLVTKARATNAIHPKVVAMEAGCGHSAIGGVAQAERHHGPGWATGKDADVRHNLWWEDRGVNPNDIIPLFIDPASGAAALSMTVKVEPAMAGDKYGDIKVDINLHEAFYKKAMEQFRG